MPKTAQAVITITQSLIKRAFPISILLYFLTIMAMISVPPVDALILKRMADPTAGSPTAKKSSSSGSSVNGAFIGCTRSSTQTMPDIKMLE